MLYKFTTTRPTTTTTTTGTDGYAQPASLTVTWQRRRQICSVLRYTHTHARSIPAATNSTQLSIISQHSVRLRSSISTSTREWRRCQRAHVQWSSSWIERSQEGYYSCRKQIARQHSRHKNFCQGPRGVVDRVKFFLSLSSIAMQNF